MEWKPVIQQLVGKIIYVFAYDCFHVPLKFYHKSVAHEKFPAFHQSCSHRCMTEKHELVYESRTLCMSHIQLVSS